MPGAAELEETRTRAEAKGAVPATVEKELDTPAGRPVTDRPTGWGPPKSTTTETAVWISPPASIAPPPLERVMWNPKDCEVVVVFDVEALEVEELIKAVALAPALALALVVLEVEELGHPVVVVLI